MNKKTSIFIIVLFVIGFLLRLFLAFHAYDKVVFDSFAYHTWAAEFLKGKWPIDCCAKNVGYSVFLAMVYRFFGIGNLTAVRLTQIGVELMSAGLLYGVAKRLFGVPRVLYSLGAFLFNPFTSAFTGLVLAETLSVFFVALISYLITAKRFLTYRSYWFLFGILLGLFLFIRHSMYYIGFTLIFFFAMLVFKKTQKLLFVLLATAGLVVGSSYSLVTYYKNFHVVSFVPPYNLKWEIMYLNYYRWHYPEVEFKGEHPMYREVVQSYWNTPLEKKKEHSDVYKALFFERLPSELPTLITNLSWNVIWLWDKDHLFTYVDPFYPGDQWLMRFINIALITLFIFGFFRYLLKQKQFGLHDPLILFTLLLFSYITFLFPLLSNESRHTIVFYPLVAFWAGQGIWYIGHSTL